jgi:hypothetical protein
LDRPLLPMERPMNRILSTATDPATGIFVEHLLYSDGSAAILGRSSFWFAYPHEGANVFDGCPGDTKREAIAKVLARFPELRRAA